MTRARDAESTAAQPHLVTAPRAHSEYVPHIDGLRAIAVLAVIVYHLRENWLPGGFAGVDVFFAISGFVVSASVANWSKGGFAAFLGYFYARRMQRIAPALLFCLLLSGVASTLFIPYAWLSNASEQTGAYAFFGLSNYFLATHRENYFSPTIEFNPYTHTWSLGVEEQFYLLFPLLFFAWTRAGRWRMFSIALFVLALGASGLWATHLGRTDPAAAFYLITTRLWELAAGVLLYQLLARRERPSGEPVRFARHAAWFSLAAVAVGMVISNPRSFPFPGAVLPVLGTLGLLGCLHWTNRRDLLPRILGSSAMAGIGRISYSLYLWHWPVFVLLRWTCGLDSAFAAIGGLLATFALAGFSYRFVERPLRYSPVLRRWPRIGVIAAGAIAITASWWLSTKVSDARATLSLNSVARNAQDWYPLAAASAPDRPGCSVRTDVAPAGRGFVAIYSRGGCAPAAASIPRIFVVGDSHAGAYTRMLTLHVLQTGTTVFAYNNGGCPFASLQPERETGACPGTTADAAADILARAHAGDVLFLPSLRLARWSNQFARTDEARAWIATTGASALAARHAAEAPAIALLSPLAAHGMHIVFDAPKPLFRAPPFRCADWFNASNPICRPGLSVERAKFEDYRRPVVDSLARIATQVSGVSIWDPLPILCPGKTCEVTRDSRPLYFDGDHLSGYANDLLLPEFEKFIDGLARAQP